MADLNWIEADELNRARVADVAYVVAANSARANSGRRQFGICQEVPVSDGGPGIAALFPLLDANAYMSRFEKRGNWFAAAAQISVIKRPASGEIELNGADSAAYVSKPGFKGKDVAVIRVTEKGISVDLMYFMLVDYPADLKYMSCVEMPKGSTGEWKISIATVEAWQVSSVAGLQGHKAPGSSL